MNYNRIKRLLFPPKALTTVMISGLCMLVVWSCTKKDKYTDHNLPFSDTINGLVLRDRLGQNVGQLGIPDRHIPTSDNTEMAIFPTPCLDVMKVAYKIADTTPATAIIALYNVRYPDAPQTYNGYNVNIENGNLTGIVALSDTVNIPANNGVMIETLDVSNLPQGFYRR